MIYILLYIACVLSFYTAFTSAISVLNAVRGSLAMKARSKVDDDISFFQELVFLSAIWPYAIFKLRRYNKLKNEK